MAYVKISDPKIIDLSTVHQIINVVNQHSDNLTALTNNFGANYAGSSGTTNAETTSYQYDISSQKILYGRTRIDFSSADISSKWVQTPAKGSNPHGGAHYEFAITFSESFTITPIVTATMQLSSATTSNSMFANMNVWVSNASTGGFKLNIRSLDFDTTKWGSSGGIYVDWIAIGPKG